MKLSQMIVFIFQVHAMHIVILSPIHVFLFVVFNLFCFFSCYKHLPDPGGPVPLPLAFIYGDSLTKYLHLYLPDCADCNIEYRVFPRPGAYISLLGDLIKEHDICDFSNFVIIHVGTNSISFSGLLTRFRHHFSNLIDITTSKFPEATILVSELLVRTDIDVTMYNIELAKLCKEKGVHVIQSAVTLSDLFDDGLHLLLDGRELFAEDIHKAACNLTSKSMKGQLPQTMIPPIRRKGKKRKKRDEEDNGKPRYHQTNRFCKKPKSLSWHQFQVFGGDGFQKIGFRMRSTPVPTAFVPQLPIPTYQSVSRVVKAAPSLLVFASKGSKMAKNQGLLRALPP